MTKVLKGVVVENDLFVEYHKFTKGKPCDAKIIKRLLHFYCNEIVSNVGQYEETGVELDANLKNKLAHAGLKRQSLESLAEHYTMYKIILSTRKNNFPYINIMNDDLRLERNFSASFDIGESRAFAVEHLKAICSHAKKITVYDKYLSHKIENVDILDKIFPKKKLNIVHKNLDTNFIAEMQKRCETWSICNDSAINDRHDRYLVIDDIIEIILSSGFDHLNDMAGDFTYIIRPVSHSRFNKTVH